MFQNRIDSLSDAMTGYNDLSTRLSAGQMLLKPSDDPSGASQAVILQNALSRMSQYDTARTYAQDALGQEDNTLDSISNLLSEKLSLVVTVRIPMRIARRWRRSCKGSAITCWIWRTPKTATVATFSPVTKPGRRLSRKTALMSVVTPR